MSFDSTYTSGWRVDHSGFLSVQEQMEVYSEIVREGTQGYSKHSSINETPEQFQSTQNSAPFDCPVYSLDPSKVNVFVSDESSPVLRDFITEREIRFPVHPGNTEAPMVEEIVSRPIARTLQVFPTASTRTVRIWDESRSALKLDLHRKISRYDRRLGPGTIGHSVEVSRRLATYLDTSSDSHTAIMKEGFGAAFILQREPKLKGWGYLHRNTELYPLIGQKTFSMPLFALYGTDPNNPQDPPLLIKILRNYQTREEKVEFVLQNVYFPVIRSWTGVFRNTGIVLEPHGQNGRLEFVSDKDQITFTGRIGHIDFDAAVDTKKLDELGLDTSKLYTGQLITERDGQEISTIYDKSVGRMMFDGIANVLKVYEGIQPSQLQEPCKAEFAHCLPEFAEYFPEGTYQYTEDPIGDNEYGYVSSGQKPKWRPAIEQMPEDREQGH